ncbi:MAG: hypothetical protein ACD_51C00355G0005 [uncultured bacterium]|nr:MAG: hypothetical protein ACD_51C00355G0005 [uncultured bacterium]
MLKLQILTIEKRVFDGEVQSVVVPTQAGMIEVLERHEPLVSAIKEGELKIKKKTGEEYLAVAGGFIKVTAEKAVILADVALRPEEIDEKEVEEARRRAKADMRRKDIPKTDFSLAAREFRRAMVNLKVARKKRSKRKY